MKNKIVFILVLMIICTAWSSIVVAQEYYYDQPPYFGHEFVFNKAESDSYAALDTTLYRIEDFKGFFNAKHPVRLGVKLDPKLTNFYSASVKAISREYPSYIISDTSSAILIAYGVTNENVNDYRYHVVEDDSVELVPWTKPILQQKYGARKPYGFLGKFARPGKQLLVEVVNVKNYNLREGILLDWKANFRPVITRIFVDCGKDDFDLNDMQKNRGYARTIDNNRGIPLDFKFPVDSIATLRLYYKHHETMPYVVYLIKNIGGKKDTTEMGYYNREDYFDIENKYYKQVGDYELIIQRAADLGAWPENQVLRIPFKVLAPPVSDKKVSLKQALPYIIATLTGVVLLFGAYYRRNQVKLLRAAQAKQTAGLKLRSIRAQLNPHFMFNALTSIQNLVNKNDITAANHYLSKFAGLTRQVLDTGNEELLSLEQEINILDDYLQMEQLRFGFKYHIDVDKGLNKANIEIPAMLLQPFVENAVKHGVAILKDAGRIEIVINRVDNDIIFCIKDNGKWIDANGTAGYGLKLSEERVVLLNQLYKDQPVRLTIDKQPATVVCIRLTNWI